MTFADLQLLVPTTAAAEQKDIYEVNPGTSVTVGTSAGHVAVTEPETSDDKSVTGQTTPPYNPNN